MRAAGSSGIADFALGEAAPFGVSFGNACRGDADFAVQNQLGR
jgi:hypothetical protein